MDYNEWYELNEDCLKARYAEELPEVELHDAVFFWDWPEEQILKDAKKARERFSDWCQAEFDMAEEDTRDIEQAHGQDR